MQGTRLPLPVSPPDVSAFPVRVWEEHGSWKPVASAHVGLSSVGLSVSPHHDWLFPSALYVVTPTRHHTVWLPLSFPL